MGFRTTYISEDWNIQWPDWFREKHSTWINKQNMIVSPCEIKFADEIMQDIHKSLLEVDWFKDWELDRAFAVVGLHECGGVTKIDFTREKVFVGNPTGWDVEESDDWINSQHGHVYCYGCSDLKDKLNEEEE